MKKILAAALLAILPQAGAAESWSALAFSAGIGASVGPDYFGSDEYGIAPTGAFDFHYLRFGRLEVGNPDPDYARMGLHPRASFRFVGERTAADNPELAGMRDVGASVELGAGIGYRADRFLAFADVRYGVIGHNAVVGEVGADLILRPTERLTLTAGPRALWGSEGYTRTYFGVTPAEAGASAFTAYTPGAGFVSAGVAVGATYRFDEYWGIEAEAGWNVLTGDAAGSPIVRSDDSFGVSLALTRYFSLGK